MAENIILSIIMPVYNVEQYLPECLDSIVGQLTPHTELICVDDGSTDSSGRICDEYSSRCRFVISLHQKNAGVSAARNAGLKLAKGEHITFIDSDDFVSEDYIQEILSSLGNQELLVFEFSKIKYDGHTEYHAYPRLSEGYNSFSDIFEEIKESHFFQCFDKVFSSELLRTHSISFEEGCIFGEDMRFVLKYSNHIGSAFCIKKSLYHYRLRENSGSQNTTLTYLKNHVENYAVLRAFLEKHACDDFNGINRTTFYIICQCLERLSPNELRTPKKGKLLSDSFTSMITDFPHDRGIIKLRVFLLKHRMFKCVHALGWLKTLLF